MVGEVTLEICVQRGWVVVVHLVCMAVLSVEVGFVGWLRDVDEDG
jgi:hypothetical protein